MHKGLLLLLIFGGFAVYVGLLVLVGSRWGGKGVAVLVGGVLAILLTAAVIVTWGVPL